MSAAANEVLQADTATSARQIFMDLVACGAGETNTLLLAKMLASQFVGDGCMPRRLGLRMEQFENLMDAHFPLVTAEYYDFSLAGDDPDRRDERLDLETLLLAHVDRVTPELSAFAGIVSAGCMASNHLWQDLGLWSRRDLSELFINNFPRLAEKNIHDMKWKKFLYKQLCNQEGIYTCRAPSCEVCDDYAACFGPEE